MSMSDSLDVSLIDTSLKPRNAGVRLRLMQSLINRYTNQGTVQQITYLYSEERISSILADLSLMHSHNLAIPACIAHLHLRMPHALLPPFHPFPHHATAKSQLLSTHTTKSPVHLHYPKTAKSTSNPFKNVPEKIKTLASSLLPCDLEMP